VCLTSMRGTTNLLGTLDNLCDNRQCGFGVMSVNSGPHEWIGPPGVGAETPKKSSNFSIRGTETGT